MFDFYIGLYIKDNCYKRGKEWERSCHIEFYEPDGTLGFSKYIGLRIHGGTSRNFPQKSLRLYADHACDGSSNFEYEVFPGYKKKFDGKDLKKFSRLILRNSGTDWQKKRCLEML